MTKAQYDGVENVRMNDANLMPYAGDDDDYGRWMWHDLGVVVVCVRHKGARVSVAPGFEKNWALLILGSASSTYDRCELKDEWISKTGFIDAQNGALEPHEPEMDVQ